MKNILKNIFDIRFVMILFVVLSLPYFDLPGLYMDAVNPDYISEYILGNGKLPAWIYPDNAISTLFGKPWGFPLLNSLYGTNFTAYILLLVSLVIGNGVYAVRMCHILFFVAMIYAAYRLVLSATNNKKIATLAGFLIAIEPSIIFAQRSQYYLQLFPLIFFYAAIALIISQVVKQTFLNGKQTFIAGILFGVAVGLYFIFAGYFVGVFLVVAIYMILEKKQIKKILTLVVSFVIGYLPYIYAHLSILVQKGPQNYIETLKSVDNYGLTDGQKGIIYNIYDFTAEYMNLFSGNSIIHTFTGESVSQNWFVYVISVFLLVVAICSMIYVIIRIKQRNFSAIIWLIAFVDSTIIMHLFIAMLAGAALSYQHYIMIIPNMMLISVLFFYEIYNNQKQSKQNYTIKSNVIGEILVCVYVVISAVNIASGYSSIARTGGIGYYSHSINTLGYYLKDNVTENDVIICPQWGYWMGIAVITEGKSIIWNDTSLDIIVSKLSNSQIERLYIVDDNQTDDALIDDIIQASRKKVSFEVPFERSTGNTNEIRLLVVE